MKTISIVIPTYNEEDNINLIYERVTGILKNNLSKYDYRILFIDNCSTDSSRTIIRTLGKRDSHVQYIFNIKNFGFSRSTFYGLTQAKGDCVVLLFADMQDPPELIVDFVKEWERGYKVVAGIKNKSKESKMMYFVRKCYYSFINKIVEIQHIDQFTGFGLYDKSVIETFAKLEDPLPYLRGIVAELAPECKKVYYEQNRREHGKSSFKFKNLYDVAMLGITSYSKALMRMSTFLGVFVAGISFLIAIITFFLKVFHVIEYPIGNAAIIFGVFFLGGLQLVFIGLLGEYISNVNIRSMKRPLVVEEERYNLD